MTVSENGFKVSFWVMSSVIFALVLGSFGFTAMTTKALADNMVTNDRIREKDKDDLRTTVENFNMTLMTKIDYIAQQTAEIKAQLNTYVKVSEDTRGRVEKVADILTGHITKT